MYFKINKLYSNNNFFEPISFHNGLNLIIGEKSETLSLKNKDKTNGTGKSTCIDFINFMLLKEVKRLNAKSFLRNFLKKDVISLDFEINSKKYTLHRNILEPNKVSLIDSEGHDINTTVIDCKEYLRELLFINYVNDDLTLPTFRGLFQYLVRDEGSEFKQIEVTQEKRDVPVYKQAYPILFIFGINHQNIKEYADLLDQKSKVNEKIKVLLKELNNDTLLETSISKTTFKTRFGSFINKLKSEIKDLEAKINEDDFDVVVSSNSTEYASLQSNIERLQDKRTVLFLEIDQLKKFPKFEEIDTSELEQNFSIFSQSLGTLIKKNFDEAQLIAKKINVFKTRIIDDQIAEVQKSINEISVSIKNIQFKQNKLEEITKKRSLKENIMLVNNAITKKKIELNHLTEISDKYYFYDAELANVQTSIDKIKNDYSSKGVEFNDKSKSLADTIECIYKYIMKSSGSSFEFISDLNSTLPKKIFDLYIPDEESNSISKERVFIFDIALLINKFTSSRHIGFLVHDNILRVDTDTIIQSLNIFQEDLFKDRSFQYIITLNRDEIEHSEKELNFEIDKLKVATFTKDKRFLNFAFDSKF